VTNWRQEKQNNAERLDMNKRKAKKMQRKNKMFLKWCAYSYKKLKKKKREYHECLIIIQHQEKRKDLIIESIKKETGFSADVIGCFVSNYNVYPICPRATNSWCRDYTKCQVIESMCKAVL
jgi:hypothetical protein